MLEITERKIMSHIGDNETLVSRLYEYDEVHQCNVLLMLTTNTIVYYLETTEGVLRIKTYDCVINSLLTHTYLLINLKGDSLKIRILDSLAMATMIHEKITIENTNRMHGSLLTEKKEKSKKVTMVKTVKIVAILLTVIFSTICSTRIYNDFSNSLDNKIYKEENILAIREAQKAEAIKQTENIITQIDSYESLLNNLVAYEKALDKISYTIGELSLNMDYYNLNRGEITGEFDTVKQNYSSMKKEESSVSTLVFIDVSERYIEDAINNLDAMIDDILYIDSSYDVFDESFVDKKNNEIEIYKKELNIFVATIEKELELLNSDYKKFEDLTH